MNLGRWLVRLERAWDTDRLRRAGSRVPVHFRIEGYLAHGGAEGVVVRGRVLDDPPSSEAVEGEGVGAAVRRTLRDFVTNELPGVPLRVTVADVSVQALTDAEGYSWSFSSPTRACSRAPGPGASSSWVATTEGCVTRTSRRSRYGSPDLERGSGSSRTSMTRSWRPGSSGSDG